MGFPCKNLFLTFLVWVLIDLSATFPRSKSTLFTNPSSRLNTSIHFHFSGSKRCAVVRALWRWKSWNRMRHTMHIWVCHHFQIWAAIFRFVLFGVFPFYFGEPIFQMWFGEPPLQGAACIPRQICWLRSGAPRETWTFSRWCAIRHRHCSLLAPNLFYPILEVV